MPDTAINRLKDELKVSHETLDRLKTYHDLLCKWQKKINLISNDTVDHIWDRHILDSLQLLKYIANPDSTIIDIGTGAGFPGMALAMAGYSDVHLVESDGKKIAFLKEVSRVTKTKVSIHHIRIEKFNLPKTDYILSRACSELNELLSHSINFVSHETICLFHKGKKYSMEIEDAKKNFDFTVKIFPSICDLNGVILQITDLRRGLHDSKHSANSTAKT